MEREITVQKTVWVTRLESSYLYDEFILTYKSVKRVKHNLYWFRLTDITKINDKPFGGGGGYIIRGTPRIGDRKLLRLHKISWNAKNYTHAGRVKRWFNVKWPCKDEDYIQHPTELYPIWCKNNYVLSYPKTYGKY